MASGNENPFYQGKKEIKRNKFTIPEAVMHSWGSYKDLPCYSNNFTIKDIKKVVTLFPFIFFI